MIFRSPYPMLEFPEQTDYTSFVLEGASTRSERPALIDSASGHTYSFGELVAAVHGLAAGLAARGIGRGDVVALYLPNMAEYAVVFHGVCAAGATNTTVNPLYTPGELAGQLRDSHARMLVTAPEFLQAAREGAAQAGVEEIVVVGEAEGAMSLDELICVGAKAPAVSIDPAEDLAVLPYSSGTTGLPKGVMLTHRNLVANIAQTQAAIALADDDVVLAVLPFFHIYGMQLVMNLGLRAGATIVTMPRFDLGGFLDLIERHRATRLFIVPPIALALAKHPAVEGRDTSSVRTILTGAAPLGAELERAVAARLGTAVLQGYGMTEASPVTHLSPIDPQRSKAGTVGLLVAGTECRLVDPETGSDVGVGAPGELWSRGPQVMRGYLGNEQATAATLDEDGWLHSGDIAVVDSEGYFTIVDRLKELIKYKGFQVAPAELEALLQTHPAVVDVAVIGVPDEEAGELPKAFVVAGAEVTDEELLDYVAQRVSPHKRVRVIERVQEIPKSPSGKILRRVLRDREQ
jgi:acyl-CoA synthetase (AMP-forming)/AMP-acid ligase II